MSLNLFLPVRFFAVSVFTLPMSSPISSLFASQRSTSNQEHLVLTDLLLVPSSLTSTDFKSLRLSTAFSTQIARPPLTLLSSDRLSINILTSQPQSTVTRPRHDRPRRIHMFDMSGQQSERKTWIHCSDGVERVRSATFGGGEDTSEHT